MLEQATWGLPEVSRLGSAQEVTPLNPLEREVHSDQGKPQELWALQRHTRKPRWTPANPPPTGHNQARMPPKFSGPQEGGSSFERQGATYGIKIVHGVARMGQGVGLGHCGAEGLGRGTAG